jgi:hypothetical protein
MAKINKAHRELLKKEYENAANKYIDALFSMYEMDSFYGYWIAGVVGGVYAYGDTYFFNFDDVRYLVDNEIPLDVFEEWSDYCIEAFELGISQPNLQSWVKGCPRASKEEIQRLKNIKKQFEEECDKLNDKY